MFTNLESIMETTVDTSTTRTSDAADTASPSYQAFRILQFGFVAAPIIAGLDKFFNVLVNWEIYLWAPLGDLVGGDATFMAIVGAIEVLAGIGVALKPRIFGYVVSAWLVGIIINLLLTGGYLDIALRDLGLALGALALGRLSETYDRG